MLDDATLAEWEQKAKENWMGTVTEHLLATVAEIRRLREERNYALGKETDAKNELANRDYVEWRRAYDSDLGKRIEILSQNLSAHQAVVRAAEAYLDAQDDRLKAMIAKPKDVEQPSRLDHIRRLRTKLLDTLNDALIVAARTEGRDEKNRSS